MEHLAYLGVDATFRLGDRDLATCLVRTRALAGGATLRLLASVQVEVVSQTGDPVPGAALHLRSQSGASPPAVSAGDEGRVDVLVPTHVVNAATLVALTPAELTVQAAGYAPRTVRLTEPLPASVKVTLDPLG